MYVDESMCVHVFGLVLHVYAHAYECMSVYMCASVCVCVCVCVCNYVLGYLCVCVPVSTAIPYSYVCIPMYAHAHIPKLHSYIRT